MSKSVSTKYQSPHIEDGDRGNADTGTGKGGNILRYYLFIFIWGAFVITAVLGAYEWIMG